MSILVVMNFTKTIFTFSCTLNNQTVFYFLYQIFSNQKMSIKIGKCDVGAKNSLLNVDKFVYPT
ncbi:hypothetical protein BZG79_13535 [Salinivibrio sp. MA427]|nr:hypothetical protein BZG79_13535 [Salinivibrio sp. MA427]